MMARDEAQGLFGRVLAEFAPDWEPLDDLAEVTIRDRDHWLSGIGTFGVTLRNRRTGAFKVLGRRGPATPTVQYHRGISFLVLKAYAERNTDPVRRYLDEIGLSPLHRPAPAYKTG
jgi:hypothetical protein